MIRLLSVTAMCLAAIVLSFDSAHAQAQPPIYTNTGATPLDNSGYSVAIIGDITGDGRAEFIVGEQTYTPGTATASTYQRGRFILYDGSNNTVLMTVSGAASDRLGSSVTGLGDIDGDTVPDFCVGAVQGASPLPFTLPTPGNGYVLVYSGGNLLLPPVVLTVSPAPLLSLNGAGFGISVANLGDVTGDTINDIGVGAYFDVCTTLCSQGPGSVTVFSGATIFTPPLTSFKLSPGGLNEEFGFSVDGIGDLDGDGKNEILVGAPQNSSGQGLAYVFSSLPGHPVLFPASLSVIPTPHDNVGWCIRRAGDVNLDGFEDFLVGIPQLSTSGPGRVELRSGATFGLLATLNDSSIYSGFASGSCTTGFGICVSGVGDFNGDGYPDFAIGGSADCFQGPDAGTQLPGTTGFLPPAPWATGYFGAASGSVRIISGFSKNVIKMFNGSVQGSQFGYSISAGGDVDGDGFRDILIGAPSFQTATPSPGYAVVESGRYQLGQVYGYSNPNSTGVGATIRATGSLSISDNHLVLLVSNVPPGVLGQLYFGTTMLSTPVPASMGLNWIGSPVTLMPRTTTPVGSSVVAITLNLAAAPFAGVVTPGSELAFQFVFSEPSIGAAVTNRSDAVNIGFLP